MADAELTLRHADMLAPPTPAEPDTPALHVTWSPWAGVDEQLVALAEHLQPPLAERIRKLVAADAIAHRVIELERRAQRAEDLANECRLQLRSAHRQVDWLRDELEQARQQEPR